MNKVRLEDERQDRPDLFAEPRHLSKKNLARALAVERNERGQLAVEVADLQRRLEVSVAITETERARQRPMKALIDSLQAQCSQAHQTYNEYRAALETLDSERAANAQLTEELERANAGWKQDAEKLQLVALELDRVRSANSELVAACQKIDSIAQAFHEGGYGKEGDRREMLRITGLAQTWLKVAALASPEAEQRRPEWYEYVGIVKDGGACDLIRDKESVRDWIIQQQWGGDGAPPDVLEVADTFSNSDSDNWDCWGFIWSVDFEDGGLVVAKLTQPELVAPFSMRPKQPGPIVQEGGK